MTITSSECAGVGTVLSVTGPSPISGTISENACLDAGASLTLGPASEDGALFFLLDDQTYGSGSFQFTGTYPSYTVLMEDGYGDEDFNDAVISVEILAACQHNVVRHSQGGGGWGGTQYDNLPGTTMATLGCALTALTMALNSAGVNKTPGEVNEFMRASGLFAAGGGVYFPTAVKGLTPGLNLTWRPGTATTAIQLAREVCAGGRPIVIGVTGSTGKFPGHYVIVTGVENGRITIADPGNSDRTRLDSAYNNQFLSRGTVVPADNNPFRVRHAVADPLGDQSLLAFSVNNADLLVVDPAARETGTRFATGENVLEIPQSAHVGDAIDNDVTGQEGIPLVISVGISQPAQGTYQVHVRALLAGPLELVIHGFSSDGTMQPVRRFPLDLDVGETASFSIAFDGGSWPNEPTGSVLVTEQPWNSFTHDGWDVAERDVNNFTIEQDASAPFSASGVLRGRFPAGFTSGVLGFAYRNMAPTPRVYAGVWWKPSSPWQKPGISIQYLGTSNGHISMWMVDSAGLGGPYKLQVMPQLESGFALGEGQSSTGAGFSSFSSEWLKQNVSPNVSVTLGEWHRIEWLVDYSDESGRIQWWLDGVLLGDYSNDPAPPEGHQFIQYSYYVDWIGPAKPQTDYVWYDHAHVSIPQ